MMGILDDYLDPDRYLYNVEDEAAKCASCRVEYLASELDEHLLCDDCASVECADCGECFAMDDLQDGLCSICADAEDEERRREIETDNQYRRGV